MLQEDWDILKRPVYKTPPPSEQKQETEEVEDSIDAEFTPAGQIVSTLSVRPSALCVSNVMD